MIQLARTNDDAPRGPDFTIYDDVTVEIRGGFENTTEDWFQYFAGFLMQIGFRHYQVLQAMKNYIQDQEFED